MKTCDEVATRTAAGLRLRNKKPVRSSSSKHVVAEQGGDPLASSSAVVSASASASAPCTPLPVAKPSHSISQSEPFNYLFKIVLVGDTGVGKSCLLVRFTDDTFSERMTATIGVDFRIRTMTMDGSRVKLQVWDSAGQERFRSLTSSYYRGAHAVAVVFELTCPDSIDAVASTWVDEVDFYCPGTVPRILVGNKCDLVSERQVSEDHARNIADSSSMLYIETSAKTAQNVYEAFENIVRDIIRSQHDSAPLVYHSTDSNTGRLDSRIPVNNDDRKNHQSNTSIVEKEADIVRLSHALHQAEQDDARQNKRCC